MNYWWRNLKKTQIMESYLMFMDWKINIATMSILSKVIYRLFSPYQNSKDTFQRNRKKILKFGITNTLNSQSNLKKGHSQIHHISWFQIILQTLWSQTVLHWYKNRHIDLWNKIETSGIKWTYIANWSFTRAPWIQNGKVLSFQ